MLVRLDSVERFQLVDTVGLYVGQAIGGFGATAAAAFSWQARRLEECTMYVTLEPCQMCAGAIVQARIPNVVIGCMNPKAGCAGSIINLLDMKQFNHQVEVIRGVRQDECSEMMKSFFRDLRQGKAKNA